jgi:transcriptional regulator GlxA family with amidase domain
MHEPLPTQEIAEHCGVSLRTLEKAFGDLRGTTPVAYIRNVRLDHARRALADGAGTVSDVAARFGFRSATTFAIEYRKRFGLTPRDTKKKV